MDGRDQSIVTSLDHAARLVHSAMSGFLPIGDRIERLARAKEFLGGLGADDDTPVGMTRELLAARDDLGALLLGVVILGEVGVAEAATCDLLVRGSARCYRRLQTLARVDLLGRVNEPVS